MNIKLYFLSQLKQVIFYGRLCMTELDKVSGYQHRKKSANHIGVKSDLHTCDPAQIHMRVKKKITSNVFSLVKSKWDTFGKVNQNQSLSQRRINDCVCYLMIIDGKKGLPEGLFGTTFIICAVQLTSKMRKNSFCHSNLKG